MTFSEDLNFGSSILHQGFLILLKINGEHIIVGDQNPSLFFFYTGQKCRQIEWSIFNEPNAEILIWSGYPIFCPFGSVRRIYAWRKDGWVLIEKIQRIIKYQSPFRCETMVQQKRIHQLENLYFRFSFLKSISWLFSIFWNWMIKETNQIKKNSLPSLLDSQHFDAKKEFINFNSN